MWAQIINKHFPNATYPGFFCLFVANTKNTAICFFSGFVPNTVCNSPIGDIHLSILLRDHHHLPHPMSASSCVFTPSLKRKGEEGKNEQNKTKQICDLSHELQLSNGKSTSLFRKLNLPYSNPQLGIGSSSGIVPRLH